MVHRKFAVPLVVSMLLVFGARVLGQSVCENSVCEEGEDHTVCPSDCYQVGGLVLTDLDNVLFSGLDGVLVQLEGINGTPGVVEMVTATSAVPGQWTVELSAGVYRVSMRRSGWCFSELLQGQVIGPVPYILEVNAANLQSLGNQFTLAEIAPGPCAQQVCQSGAECDDNDLCTTDSCSPENSCLGVPLNCDDGDACTIDACMQGICHHEATQSPECCNEDFDCTATDGCSAGTCEQNTCNYVELDTPFAAYVLPECHIPGQQLQVVIDLSIEPSVVVVGLEDEPPVGWDVVPGSISDAGFWDAANGKVKWGPFFAPQIPEAVSYQLIVPDDNESPVVCWSGSVSIDGLNTSICGLACAPAQCELSICADRAQVACPSCGADCDACGECNDCRVELCEVVSYACQWKKGCNDDITCMSRSAFLWKNGECYCYDPVEQQWFPSECGASCLCTESPRLASQSDTHAAQSETLEESPSPRVRARFAVVSVELALDPLEEATVYGVEELLPTGAIVLSASNEGVWDRRTGKLKWGPLFNREARALSYTLRLPEGRIAEVGILGRVSCDGLYETAVEYRNITRRE